MFNGGYLDELSRAIDDESESTRGLVTKEAVKPLALAGGYKAIGGTPIKAVYPVVQYTV